MMKLSDYVIQYLERLSIPHMFMLPGGGAMHLNDSLGRSGRIQYVACLHEQACAIAAEAYARVTGISLCACITLDKLASRSPVPARIFQAVRAQLLIY